MRMLKMNRTMAHALLCVCATTLLALAPPGVHAITLENFADGPFDLENTSPAILVESQTRLSPSNVIGGERVVILGGGTPILPATARLVLSPADDEVEFTRGGPGPRPWQRPKGSPSDVCLRRQAPSASLSVPITRPVSTCAVAQDQIAVAFHRAARSPGARSKRREAAAQLTQ